jgi:hypothetical protein
VLEFVLKQVLWAVLGPALGPVAIQPLADCDDEWPADLRR